MPSGGRLIRIITLTLLLTLACIRVSGQDEGPFFLCQAFGKDQGLPDAHVRCTFEDSRGLLWIGTENGVSCFDGRFFRNYSSHHGEDRISGFIISSIAEDESGVIWLGAQDGGLTRLDPRKPPGSRCRIFLHHPADPASLPSNRIRALASFDSNHLIISAEGAPVVFLRLDSFSFSIQPPSPPFHPRRAAASAGSSLGWFHSFRKNNDLLTACYLNNCRVWHIDPATGAPATYPVFPPQLYPGQTITEAIQTGDWLYGCGWFNGVLKWRATDSTQYEVLAMPEEAASLCKVSQTTLLAGGNRGGLYLIDTEKGSIQPVRLIYPEHSPSRPKHLYCLTRDVSGQIWAGTSTGLLKLWQEPEFISSGHFASLIPEPLPPSLIELENGSVACLSGEQWLTYQPQSRKSSYLRVQQGATPIQLNTLTYTPAWGVVLGTETGLYFWDAARRQARPFPPLNLKGESAGSRLRYDFLQIRALFSDTLNGKPVLLAGVLGYGVAIIDPESRTIEFLVQEAGCVDCIQNNLIRVMKKTEGGYWIGASRGLYFWPFDRHTPNKHMQAWLFGGPEGRNLPAEGVNDLYLDSQKRLWVATHAGLACLYQGRLQRIAAPPKQTRVISITPLRDGRLLLASPDGWMFYDPKQNSWANAFPPGQDAGWEKALQTQEGWVLLCSGSQWAVIPAAALDALPPFPIPYLADLQVGDVPADTAIAVRLAHNQSLAYRLSTLGRGAPGPWQLQYRWDMHKAWQEYPLPEWQYLSNLAHGSGLLSARVLHPDGTVVWQKDLLRLEVVPPFWRRWQFLVAALTLIMMAFFGLFRYRLSQIKARERMRTRIAADLHDEVGSALSSILIGADLTEKRLLMGDMAGINGLIAAIQRTTSETLENMADIVWAIHPPNDKAGRLPERMRQIGFDLLEQNGIAVDWQLSPAFEHSPFSMEKRQHLIRWFKEAANNIARHSGATRVGVKASLVGGMATLEVEDNGKGFQSGAHSGLGLESMRQRALALGGVFSLRSAPGEGTSFAIRFPSGRAAPAYFRGAFRSRS